MAESGNNSNNEENGCGVRFSDLLQVMQQNESNLFSNESRSSGKSSLSDEIGKLVKENLELEEKKLELQRLTTNLLQEHRRLSAKRKSQEKASIASAKSEASITAEIMDRLLTVYTTGKENEIVFQKFLEYLKMKIKNSHLIKTDNKGALERKLSLLESRFTSFKEQLATIETLLGLEKNYDELCQEDSECYETVMKECNKVDDSIYDITCMILEEE